MSRLQAVDQGIPYGVYIWQVDGKPVVNENYDYLQIASRRGDQRKIHALKEFVNKNIGIYEGQAVFVEGARPVSEDEYNQQRERQAAGLVADPYDLGNLIDEYKHEKALDSGEFDK